MAETPITTLSNVLDVVLNGTNAAAVQVDPTELGVLLQSVRPLFLDLLKFQGPNPASRQQVESCRITFPDGETLTLDKEPDVRFALRMSAALNLDEITCVQFLLAAHDQHGSFTPESATGIYLSRRQSTLQCLMRLLSEVATQVTTPQDAQRTAYTAVIQDFMAGLLSDRSTEGSGGRGPQTLLMRLIALLKDTSLEVTPNSDLIMVQDEAGLPLNRAEMLQLERRLLAKCLLYSLVIDQRAAPAVVSALLDLTVTHSTRAVRPMPVGGAVSSEAYSSELGQLLQLSLILALTPQEERGAQERDALVALFQSAEVKSKVFPAGSRAPGTPILAATATPSYTPGTPSATAPAGGPMPPALQGPYALLRLCWAVLSVSAAPQQGAVGGGGSLDEAKKLMQEVPGNRTLTYLKQFFLSPLFREDSNLHQDIVACCVYRLLGQALQADTKVDNALMTGLDRRTMLAVHRTGGGGLAFRGVPADSHSLKWDQMGTVLGLLAAVFDTTPRLWLHPDGGAGECQRVVENIITRAVTSDAMKVSPEVRIPFFQMMTSLAAGEYGTSLVLRQFQEMGRTPPLEMLTWRKLVSTVIEYCGRYNQAIDELGRLGATGSGTTVMIRSHEERLMNAYEAGILVSAIGLLRQIVEQGNQTEVYAFLENLQREMSPHLSGFPLQEPFFQLMCYPVPNIVKASLDALLATLAQRFPDAFGRHILVRLVQSAVIMLGMQGSQPGVPRLDLVTQLNEIESRKEEYPETLAFLQLINALLTSTLLKDKHGLPLAPVGSGGSAADDGTAYAHFTQFVVQHVLAHLWQRGYRRPSQRWEVAALALQHLELMLEVQGRCGSKPQPNTDQQAPGLFILEDILSSGPCFQALVNVLGPGYDDLTSSALQSAAAAAAADSQPGEATAASSGARWLSEDPVSVEGPFDRVDPVRARQAAVLAAMRVVNKVLQLDQSFVSVASRGGQPGAPRFPTLDTLLTQTGTQGTGMSGMGVTAQGGMRGDSGPLVSVLLQYVCYQDSDDIQVEAIRLLQSLALRIPTLVEQLPLSSDAGDGESEGPRLTLRRGVAVALRESLSRADTIDSLHNAEAQGRGTVAMGIPARIPPHLISSHTEGDPRAALILRILIDSVHTDANPSVTHLLMGYDPESSMSGIEDSMLVPSSEYSCLTVISEWLIQGQLATTKPQLYAQMLRVVYMLAREPRTAPPMLNWLSPASNGLVTALRRVLLLPAPQPTADTVVDAASSLRQWSYILRLQALLLLRFDNNSSIQSLLSDLIQSVSDIGLADPAGTGAVLAQPARGVADSTLMHLLHGIVNVRAQEPQVSDMSPESRRLQAEMSVNDISVEALLVQPHVQELLGLYMESVYGDAMYDLPKIFTLVKERLDQYTGRNGQPTSHANDSLALASQDALRYIQLSNGYQMLTGAQAAATEAWLQVVEMAFTHQYAQLAALGSDSEAAQALMEVLLASLKGASSVLSQVTSNAAETVAGYLVNVARVLLSKLVDLGTKNVSLGQASDPLLLVRTPAKCAELLRLLLDLTDRSRRAASVRIQLYAALLQYMQFCKGSRMGSCSPVVLKALLQGQEGRGLMQAAANRTPTPSGANTPRRGVLALVPFTPNGATPSGGGMGANSDDPSMSTSEPLLTQAQVTALVAQLDAAQDAIERSNAALINRYGPMLVELVSRDALDASGNNLQQAVALHLLAALVTATANTAHTGAAEAGDGGLVGALYHHAVPQAVVQSVASLSPQLLVQSNRVSKKGVYVTQAQLGLLLALEQAGGSTKAKQVSAQHLFALQPIQRLLGCKALDLAPEDPGMRQAQQIGAGGRFGDTSLTTLRQRLQHVMAPVLRLVLGMVAGLPESTNVRQEARLFVSGHYEALHRVLKEAAESGTKDWAPGTAELEQAELSVSLLSRLVPIWDELGPVYGDGLRMALFRLSAAFLCTDGKSPSPIVSSLHTVTSSDITGRGGLAAGNRAALLTRACRVASLRAALARFLRDLVSNSQLAAPAAAGARGACVPFRYLGHASRMEVDPYTSAPTLLLIRDAAEQAAIDAGGALEELEDLLKLLRMPDSRLDDRTCVQRLLDYGPVQGGSVEAGGEGVAGGGGPLAGGLHARRKLLRHHLALAASQLDSLLGKCLFVLENSLAVIVLHFLRYLSGSIPDLSSASVGGSGRGAEELLMAAAAVALHRNNGAAGPQGTGDGKGAEALGSRQDLEYLATRLQETCVKAEDLLQNANKLGLGPSQEAGVGQGAQSERWQGVDLMVRTLKSYLAGL